MAIAATRVPHGSTAQWKDKKRYLWLIGLVVPSLAAVAFVRFQLTGWSVWLWIGPIIILVVVPAIDLVAGLDRSNPPDDVIERLEKDRYYRWITYLYLPIQYLGFVAAFVWIARPEWLGVAELSTFDKLGIAISIGCIGGIGINTAHELGHKKEATSAGCPRSRWPRASTATSTSSTTAATTSGSRRRRTPPAAGWARTSTSSGRARSAGSLTSAWRLEKRRYARKGRTPSGSATTCSTPG